MPVASRELKVVILGAGGVGKSAISTQYVQSLFVEKYDPTIEDSYRKVVEVPSEWMGVTGGGSVSLVLEIMDTAGTDQFTALRDLYMRDGDAFMLVYSINSAASLAALKTMYEQLLRAKDNSAPGSVPVLLVGNKCDLESERQISREQVLRLAERWQLSSPPIECSARQNQNVSEAFMLLVRLALTLAAPHNATGADRAPTSRAKGEKERGRRRRERGSKCNTM